MTEMLLAAGVVLVYIWLHERRRRRVDSDWRGSSLRGKDKPKAFDYERYHYPNKD